MRPNVKCSWLLAVLLAAVNVLGCESALADSGHVLARRGPQGAAAAERVIHDLPDWRVVGDAPPLTNGTYTVFSQPYVADGTLLDEATGATRSIPAGPTAQGCQVNLFFGGSSLLYDCGELELYTVPGGPWRTIPVNPRVERQCMGTAQQGGECEVAGVGTDWVESAISLHGEDGTTDYFQNLKTGRVESRTPANSFINPNPAVNLNSPSLTRTVCRPLSPPKDGDLLMAGRYAVSQHHNLWYLQRCGQHTRTLLGRKLIQVAAGAKLVAWINPFRGAPRIDGVLLPSLRRFTTALPAGFQPDASLAPIGVAVTIRHIYVYGIQGAQPELLAAPLPRP